MKALKRANQIRIRHAQLRRDLKVGRASIRPLLLDPPDYIKAAKVFDLLLALPGFGRVSVNKLLRQSRISADETIDGLSQRQRLALVILLDFES